MIQQQEEVLEMKKKFVTVISAAAVAGMLAGCSGELSNEYVTVTQYKGLEVPQASGSVEEVTDEQVDYMLNRLGPDGQ